MKNNFDDVAEFHAKFMVPVSPKPAFLDDKAVEFRVKFMTEELTEFVDTHFARDIEGAADALADLVYVAMGTAHMMGIPWQRVWDSVQTANMAKRMAKPDGSDSKRGSPLDVVKPEGWIAPIHAAALADAGFDFSEPPMSDLNVFNATKVNQEQSARLLLQASNSEKSKELTKDEIVVWQDRKALSNQIERQTQTKTVL